MYGLRLLTVALLLAAGVAPAATPADRVHSVVLQARVVATGLHRAFGIRQVGRFHGGGPFTSNAEFLLQTQAGRVLDPERVLVAVDDNFGAVPGNSSHATGAVLSIDPRAAGDALPLVVSADLATRVSAKGAAVMLYSAQSTRFMNRQHNGGARTADSAGVSGPRYVSVNNAFGRPWIANAPLGLGGSGSESVLDPDGAPLANAPSDEAGGVFFGAETGRSSVPRAVRTGWFASLLNRQPSGQLTPGSIDQGALGTALLGPSPDGSGFAVFAVVTGSGAIVQIHVQDGVDGLAPPGTIDVGRDDPGVIGIAFKWNPDRALFVADGGRDRIAVLHLADDTRHFKLARTSHIQSQWLRRPTDLAACVPEVANARFASHTTLAGGSDLYIVNRGDGSLLRMRQDGTVVARAVVEWPDGRAIGADSLRAIAVSADAQRIWLTAQAADGAGSVLLETSAFDADGMFAALPRAETMAAPSESMINAGARLFSAPFTPASGLGPRFNATSCLACHPGPGGASSHEEHFARHVARMEAGSGRILALDGHATGFAPRRSSTDFVERDGSVVGSVVGMPRSANVVSLRMPLSLTVSGRLDEIDDAAIEAGAVSKGDGIKGRVHHVVAADGTRRVGRYGWKADFARLDDMVAQALGQEMGVSSALAVHPVAGAKDDGAMVRSLSAYLRTLGTTPFISQAVNEARQ
ncbi:MAG: hypothetical protein ABI605_13685 [Rhizobacter sp.]